MQTNHVLAGVVMFIASVASSGFVHVAAASPSTETVETTSAPTVGVTAAGSPFVLPSAGPEWVEMLGSVSETTRLFAAGVALLGLAAGVRRHTS